MSLNKKRKVLDYIEYGETKEHTVRGRHYQGYHERATVAPRAQWYSIPERSKSAIFSPSIFWARYTIFHNEGGFYSTDCLDEINPYEEKYSKVLASLLNSTFSALFYEFGGRYIENRDKTISNEIKIYELKQIPTIDPKKIEKKNPKFLKNLEQTLDKIANRKVNPLFEEVELEDRQALDEIVFCNILGLSKKEMFDICEATGSLFRARVERLGEK